ncbi:MAG: hypothetical protein JKX94_03425, partial [Sneathiella sp.]|nr:hypothetical protein [Sneathiella sp.]
TREPILHFQNWTDLSAFDRLNTAVWIFNIDDHKLWWGNKSAQAFWEVSSRSALLAKDYSGDSDIVRKRLKEIFKASSSGERIEENWTLYPNGNPKMVIVSFTSAIIEGKKAALLVEASPQIHGGLDERAKRILEAVRNTPLMISTYNTEGGLLAQNPAAAGCYATNDFDQITLENRYLDRSIQQQILNCSNEQQRFTRDLKVQTVNGERWHTLTTENGLDPVSGNKVIVLTEEDVTVRIKAQEQLEHLNQDLEKRVIERTKKLTIARQEAENANKSKSNFLATMSHELRTPLNAIIGFSEMLGRQVYGPINEKQGAVLNDIYLSGKHLLELITELLEATAIDSGDFQLNETEFEYQSILDYCETVFALQTRKKQQKLTVLNTVDRLSLIGDSRRFTQILINLLGNAVKYTQPGGQITLTVTKEDKGDLRFAINDTGIGISEEMLENVCNAFTQADISSTWTAGKGVGLGLYIASKLIKAHEGKIEIESTESVGTTVSVIFPGNRVIELLDTV